MSDDTLKLPGLPQPDTASMAMSGRCVDYISGYEAGYESAADQMRELQRQTVEVCAKVAEAQATKDGFHSAHRSAAAIRSLLGDKP